MILGIDVGYSSTKFAIVDCGKIKETFLIESNEKKDIEDFAEKIVRRNKDIKKIGICGGKTKFMEFRFSIPYSYVDDVFAIGAGGLLLSGDKQAVIVSCGTGTCIVCCDDNKTEKEKFRHLGGSAVGGGTILGLSKMLLGTDKIPEISALAEKGNLSKVDLRVGDIVGKSISTLPEDMTASNLGKSDNSKKEDIAAGILNLVSEVIATNALFAAKSVDVDNIYITGRVGEIPFVRERLKEIAKLLKCKITVAPSCGYATALGAAVLSGKNI